MTVGDDISSFQSEKSKTKKVIKRNICPLLEVMKHAC